ncbi:cell wall glucanase [Fusarium langsethiae]|uniref:Cell wall glucanase n=1 Tax=Fusarium langsethiae TaxID=179993 RepID=A0A0N0DF90_FUSLA|nr:cell wall glucanase [Fusarium langsethiae]GKU02691.1 unnamed protein product [Fusarium langsethiae]GKU18592.1 unnamed protein product [Fusarium langsethiae]
MKHFFTSAVAMAAAVAAVPVGRPLIRREPVTTITLTAASTYTHVVAPATPIPVIPTGTATFPGTPVPVPDDPKPPKASGSELPCVNCNPSGSSGPGSSGSSEGSSGSKFPGISYAPYRGDHQCKSGEEIKQDISELAGSYSLLRIYGTECDQVSKIYPCAKANGMKLFLGIWDIDDVQSEAKLIIDAIGNDWDIVDTISVGNELVNNNVATPAQVLAAVDEARTILRAAGYNGPVLTVDTFVAVQEHPELCEKSEYCAINAHAFFDPHTSADGAGKWLSDTVQVVKSKLSSDKRVVICETGWPTKGDSNGKAVPGLTQQGSALKAIREAFVEHPDDLILFSAFNDHWKKPEPATFHAEQHWGIGGKDSTSE